jgi:hypothetical protein
MPPLSLPAKGWCEVADVEEKSNGYRRDSDA